MVICFCSNDDGPFVCGSNSTCEVNGYCYSSHQIIYDEQNRPVDVRKTAGCLFNNDSGLLLCKTKNSEINYTCCKGQDLCNEADYVRKTKLIELANIRKSNSSSWTTACLLAISIIFIIVAVSLVLISIHQNRKMNRRKRNHCIDGHLLQSNRLTSDCFSDDELIEGTSTGQKGKDDKFESSKLYNELNFVKVLKDGKFICKHQAKRHGIDVVVKIFKGEQGKKLWLSEINIYKIILIRHENVLNFVAKSQFYDQQLKQLNFLTVTDYHELGNLESFLKTRPKLNKEQMLKLMTSASSGLNHLHLEISNNQRKPSIVHRNLNPKNFIVKQNLTCALANFNYAIKSTELDDVLCDCEAIVGSKQMKKKRSKICEYCKNLPIYKIVCNPLVYCPPEYLDNSINCRSIVSLKSADIYSFGLVLWQISNYFYTGNYRIPFYGQFDELVDKHSAGDACESDAQLKEEDANRMVNMRRNLKNYDELKRLKNLIFEQRKILDMVNDDLSFEEIFSYHEKRDELLRLNSPCSSRSAHSTSNEKPQSKEDELRLVERINEVKIEMDRLDVNAGMNGYLKMWYEDLRSLKIDGELFRIIREACYIEPLSRLSVRKSESDLNKLLRSENGE